MSKEKLKSGREMFCESLTVVLKKASMLTGGVHKGDFFLKGGGLHLQLQGVLLNVPFLSKNDIISKLNNWQNKIRDKRAIKRLIGITSIIQYEGVVST